MRFTPQGYSARFALLRQRARFAAFVANQTPTTAGNTLPGVEAEPTEQCAFQQGHTAHPAKQGWLAIGAPPLRQEGADGEVGGVHQSFFAHGSMLPELHRSWVQILYTCQGRRYAWALRLGAPDVSSTAAFPAFKTRGDLRKWQQ